MGMRIDNRFKYFKDINEALKRKYDTTEDFPYSEMAEAIDNIPSGAEIEDVEINSEGHLIVTFSDGTTMDAGYIGIPTISIAAATVTLSTNSYVYDGISKLPTVQSVVLDGVSLVELQDYVVISNTEVNAGSYLILMQGIGNYSGVASANWQITKAQATISGDDSITIPGIDAPATKTYTTDGDGDFLFAITGNIATVVNVGGEVTITPTALGSTTMTVTLSEGANYLGATKTVPVEIVNPVTVFGVMWDYSLSSPQLARLTPQTDPLSVVTTVPSQEPTACVGNDGNGQSDFDNYMPWAGMQRYNYVNGQVVDFIDYSNGETFVYIPEFWSKIVDDSANSRMYFYISSAELEGFTKHLGSGRYVARYQCDNNFESKPNGTPKASTSLDGFRIGIANIDNNHFQYDIHVYNALQLLYLVEFSNFNSQSMIGSGNTSTAGAQVLGQTDYLSYHTGRNSGTDSESTIQYRWIENLWGNIWDRVDGILIQDGHIYLCNDPLKYRNIITSDYINTGCVTPTSNSWYKTGQSYSNQYLFPKTTDGSDTTFTCDYFYYNVGVRAVAVSGANGDNTRAGLFFWYGHASPDAAVNYIGGRSILIIQNGGDS